MAPEGAPAPAGPRYRPRVRRQLQDHPGTWLTFLYLAPTAIGLTYTLAYHAPFRSNLLDDGGTSDFLHPGGRARYRDVANTALIATHPFALALYDGLHSGRRVINGRQRRVRMELVAGALAPAGTPGPSLVGSTTRAPFLYSPERDSTHAVPANNVALAALEPRARRQSRLLRRRERARANAAAPAAPPPR